MRIDSTAAGHHVGNNSYIGKRVSLDGGITWSEPELIFGDQYDDRNVVGGLTNDDRIILFFRRYNASNGQSVDFRVMWSDDEGQSWDMDTVDISPAIVSTTHHLIYVEGRGYMQAFFSDDYADVRFSADALTWDSITWAWDYRQSHAFDISELSLAYAGGGKMIGIIRDNSYGSFYHVSSSDTGRTWTEPVRSNIAAPWFCPAPLIFYDQQDDSLYVITTDRRSENSQPAEDSQIWIYRNHVDEVLNDPLNFNLIHQYDRPDPNWYRFYGYPSYCKKNNGNYLVIFSESLKIGSLEDADLYQFEMIRNTTSNQLDVGEHFVVFPNPYSDRLFCEGYDELKHRVEVFDLYGHKIISNFVFNGEDSAKLPSGFYLFKFMDYSGVLIGSEKIIRL